jgi:hypothetical protein
LPKKKSPNKLKTMNENIILSDDQSHDLIIEKEISSGLLVELHELRKQNAILRQEKGKHLK